MRAAGGGGGARRKGAVMVVSSLLCPSRALPFLFLLSLGSCYLPFARPSLALFALAWLVLLALRAPFPCSLCSRLAHAARVLGAPSCMAPRCTGMCGALATRPPSGAKSAQLKSSRSLMLVEMAVRWSVRPICSAMLFVKASGRASKLAGPDDRFGNWRTGAEPHEAVPKDRQLDRVQGGSVRAGARGHQLEKDIALGRQACLKRAETQEKSRGTQEKGGGRRKRAGGCR